MSTSEITFVGILVPFLGTTLGSALVFLLKNKMSALVQKILLGFASGVMMAASVWSLLIPSINMQESQNKIAWIAPSIGFLLGIFILMIIDRYVEKIELKKEEKCTDINNIEIKSSNSMKEKIKSTTMLVIAVTLHNIPEGMAVGVVFAGLLIGSAGITVAGALALALGIAIQNIPEGAIISMPLKSNGLSKPKSFIAGTLSGIVEPIGACLTILLTNFIVPTLPYLLAFAAGAMIYVVSSELIPQMQKGKQKNIGIIGLAVGFTIMMILDVALG